MRCACIILLLSLVHMSVAHAQQIPLEFDRTLPLDGSAGTSWDIAPIPGSESALIASLAGNILSFKLDSDPAWQTMGSVSAFYGLVFGPNNAVMACIMTGNNEIERIPLPELAPAETLVSWHNYTESGQYSYEEGTNTITSVRVSPGAPAVLTHVLAFGTRTHVYSYWGPHNPGFTVVEYFERLAFRPITGPVVNYLMAKDGRPLQSTAFPLSQTSFLRGCVWWNHTNLIGWRYRVGFQLFNGSGHDSSVVYTGIADYPVIGPNWIGENGMAFARTGENDSLVLASLVKLPGGHCDSVFVFRRGLNTVLWARPGNYTRLFAADIYPEIPGEEIIGLLPQTRQLGVYRSASGTLLGITTPFEGDSLDVKIIAPENASLAKLAVRSGSDVHLYHFAAPMASDLRGPAAATSSAVQISACPQPARDRVQFVLSTVLTRAADLVIYNLLGREVGRITVAPSVATVPVLTASLPSGIYFARITGSVYSSPHKFVIMH